MARWTCLVRLEPMLVQFLPGDAAGPPTNRHVCNFVPLRRGGAAPPHRRTGLRESHSMPEQNPSETERDNQADNQLAADQAPLSNGDQPAAATSTEASVAGSVPLAMRECPGCGSTEFVSKKLVYEEIQYTDDGEPTERQPHVRAELEFCCLSCGRRYHELPASSRTFYAEIGVLQADLNAACKRRLAVAVDTFLRTIRVR